MAAGAFLVGALGEVATTVLAGQRALGAGLSSPIGLVTMQPAFEGLGLIDPANLVLGGVDVRDEPVEAALERQVRSDGSVPWQLWERLRAEGHLQSLPAYDIWDRQGTGRERRARAHSLLESFCRRVGGPVVVVHLASTEAPCALGDDLEATLDQPDLPDSVVWALAAADLGCAHVNFTPSTAFDDPLVRDICGTTIPWAGNDGKTGETLLKTVLAPMFAARHFEVMSWESLNLLGNRDGEILRDPDRAAGKLSNKDRVAEEILGRSVHSKTRIDYTPSLGDWKTAWDLIHFRGFLGVPMSLQFTWQGCDSALAAPLVLDLVRLAVDALSRGETGCLRHTDVFFKNPVEAPTLEFAPQMDRLHQWARNRA